MLTEALTTLGRDSNLLERISDAIRNGGGWAGDVRPPLLGYVAMTSCLLNDPARPINLAFVSQAGTGKSRAVDAARAVMPEERCVLQRAGSEKALIYLDEEFTNRVVIFAEADSIPDDGPAASAVRSLASDNVFAYDVPEQNPETNKFETRRISKPGPTGLITTSTKSLQNQLGTRVLEVHLHDDPAQTARIIAVQAAECDGTAREVFDLAPFIEFQQWLTATAPHRVIVPFAPALGSLVPTVAVRMRRDFPQLLSCIRSIALLHKLQRDHTADGAVIADLADYAAARNLLMSDLLRLVRLKPYPASAHRLARPAIAIVASVWTRFPLILLFRPIIVQWFSPRLAEWTSGRRLRASLARSMIILTRGFQRCARPSS